MTKTKFEAPEYIERMIKEERKLSKKINKLHDFLQKKEDSISIDEYKMMKKQHKAMNEYLNILRERIEHGVMKIVENDIPKDSLMTRFNIKDKEVIHYEKDDIEEITMDVLTEILNAQ